MSNIFDLFKSIEKQHSAAPGAVEYIIAGLGNPGEEYQRSRHNIGFMAMDYLSQKLGVDIKRAKFHALTGDADVYSKRVLLMKPQTYMNNSGESVRDAAEFYKIPPERVIIIYDDISLEEGRMRIRRKGSDGGHNGIKSIIYHLQSDEFPRIKIGAGIPPAGADIIAWVLGSIPKDKQNDVYSCIEKTYGALEFMLQENIDKAMNIYNS